MLSKMNLLNRMMVLGLFGLMLWCVGGSPVQAQAEKPSAKFDRVWIDYDITEGGVKGMRIHTKFTVYGMKNVPSYVAVYFETGDGKRLRDTNKKMYSTSGEVAVYKELAISYDPGVYNDLAIFMPYEEMDLDSGEYDLKMDIDLIYKAGGLIQHMAFENFVFTQPEKEIVVPTKTNEATVKEIVIEYDVTRGGKKGMLVRANFKVYGLKGVDSYIAMYVERKNGDRLKSDSDDFSSVDGDLAIFKSLKPGFEPTVYDNAELFLPYDEIPLGTGVFDMRLDIDLIYKNGDLFKHLDFKEFVFRRGR